MSIIEYISHMSQLVDRPSMSLYALEHILLKSFQFSASPDSEGHKAYCPVYEILAL